MDDEDDPLCDLYGDCEPFPEEEDQDIAMCRFCGGTRYKDFPDLGNWGTWEAGVEEIIERRREENQKSSVRILDTHRQL